MPPESSVVVPLTRVPAGLRTSTVPVPACSGSPYVADTVALVGAPVDPGAGDRSIRLGAVVSAAVSWKTTSTQ